MNPAGAQCVNLANLWLAFEGASQFYGDASAWIGASAPSVRWISSSRVARLRVGDVGVFAVAPGTPDGHVDLVLDGTHDPYLGLDLNWPLGSPVSFQKHPRELLAGILRIR